MSHHEFDFEFHKTKFFGQYFLPKTVQAVAVLVHGMGEHSSRYADFIIPKLLENDLAVVTYDQFGHGKTSGKKGHNPGYKYLLDSLQVVIDKTEDLFEEKPLFLYGHSMGGNVVINYALKRKHNLKGLIATSPLLRLAFQPPKWKLTLGKLMQKIAPSVTLSSELDVTAISRDQQEVDKYVNDPLVHDKISANYSLAVFDAGEWAIKNSNKLNLPTLIIHGTGDQITDHKASEEFVKNTSNKTTLEIFEDGYHELHNDLEKEQLIKTIINWIYKQLT